MASRKSTGNKMKTKGPKPSRASAMPPKPPAPLRAQGGATTMVPMPPLAVLATKTPDRKNDVKAAEKAKKIAPEAAPASDGPGDDGLVTLKKQELIAQVVERSEVSKKYAKPVIEAMLEVLGAALAEGRELNLQPMGKIKRKRVKETPKARIIVANIRQTAAAAASIPADAGTSPRPSSAEIDRSTAPLRHPLKEAVAEGTD